MKFFKFATVPATAFVVFALAAIPALAVTNFGGGAATPYVAAFAPIFGTAGVPHTGTMRLVVRDAAISGTYSGTSVSPDPLDNRIEPVTGSISNDGYVLLQIGGALSLRGSMQRDGTITGTATYLGRLYEFMAKPS